MSRGELQEGQIMDSQVTYDNALELDPETKGESWKGFKHRSDMI